jgi:D-glycero-D-manno-heptose 1,7-bisphosphate phosphatase
MAVLDNHCWAEFFSPRSAEPRPCLFLDRDGVVIIDKHHLADPAGVELLHETALAVRHANHLGWAVGIVTNQSGIGQEFFSWNDFRAVQDRMIFLLAEHGARLDFVCACPFHAEGKRPYQAADHAWRKPRPGMLNHAIGALNLDPGRSLMVGDRESDLEAGRAAGVQRSVLVKNGFYWPEPIFAGAACLPGLVPIIDAMHEA